MTMQRGDINPTHKSRTHHSFEESQRLFGCQQSTGARKLGSRFSQPHQ
jgi:hypothetical protein